MRIALIGNSHLGAMKGGWELPDFNRGGVEAVFFGAPGNGLVGMHLRDGALLPVSDASRRYMKVTSGGLDRVGSAYDAYAIVGYFGIGFVADVLVGHRTLEYLEGRSAPISRAALRAAARDALSNTPALQLLQKLRHLTAAPVLLVADPLPNPRISEVDVSGRWELGHMPLVVTAYQEALEDLGRSTGAAIVTQPPETILAPCFTQPRFALDHPEHGLRHMTAEYGSLVMRDVLLSLSAIPKEKERAV
ncbi:hypothetical protein VQH23_05495 [Pararoseomonas sp. SCSIO 73927]|uniref:hypothetical protein n=1 Tax=Pararoseomonas sp. SCSIO 73927 TaxID=3114537 RepID=UPI0030D0032F